ncbi:MAG: hypothetical protein GC191_17895 [Azospirillum sp.]|nr:hypothetical protein [Azospirillum sp.]
MLTPAQDAIVLAGLLRRSLSIDDMRRAQAAAQPYLRQERLLMRLDIIDDAFLAKDSEIQWSLFRRHLEPALTGHLLPALRDEILARVNRQSPDGSTQGEADRASVIDVIEAFRSLTEWLAQDKGFQRARVLLRETGAGLAAAVETATAGLPAEIEAGDLPHLGALSLALLRLDMIQWMLELLGETRPMAAVGRRAREIARITLDRAASTLEKFLGDRDLMNMFDAVAVISQVDDLIVVVQRVIDGRAEPGDEPTHFVVPIDEQVLIRFADALWLMSDQLCRIVLRSVGRLDASERYFTSLMRQIEYLFRLSRYFNDQDRPPRLAEIELMLKQRLLGLADAVGRAALDAARRQPPDLRVVVKTVAQGERLTAAFNALDYACAAAPLTGHLRQVQAVLGPREG